MAMSGDIQHHYSTSSVNSSSSRHQQSWSQPHYSSGCDNDEAEEDHGSQLHQPLYPASEWDQKLGLKSFFSFIVAKIRLNSPSPSLPADVIIRDALPHLSSVGFQLLESESSSRPTCL